MTWVDVVVVLVLLLAAVGGYNQGVIRVLGRLFGIVAIGTTTFLVMGFRGDIQSGGAAFKAAAVIFMITAVVVSTAMWFVLRGVSPFVHHAVWNRVPGSVLAVVEGAVVLAIGIGLIERLAPDPNLQLLLRTGLITGPLLLPSYWLEQSLRAGQG